jgi:hypothetical protein
VLVVHRSVVMVEVVHKDQMLLVQVVQVEVEVVQVLPVVLVTQEMQALQEILGMLVQEQLVDQQATPVVQVLTVMLGVVVAAQQVVTQVMQAPTEILALQVMQAQEQQEAMQEAMHQQHHQRTLLLLSSHSRTNQWLLVQAQHPER